MIVSEFIEWLKTQDQGATVRVLRHTNDGCGYYEQGGTCHEVDFSLERETFEYTDFRNNQFAKGKPYEQDRFLLVGFKD